MKKNTVLPFEEFIFNGSIKNKCKAYELTKDESGYFYDITGYGTMTYNDGSIYNGNIERGKFNGFGRLTYPCEQHSYYEGYWKNGIQHGRGSYKHQQGWKCDGTWTNGILNGKCNVDFTDGTYYEGESIDNRLTGNGKLFRILMIDKKKKKVLLYDGEWSDEQFNGHGIYYYVNGNPWYIGQWKNNVVHGFGILYDETGFMISRGHFENGEYKSEFEDATLFQIQPLKTKPIVRTTLNPKIITIGNPVFSPRPAAPKKKLFMPKMPKLNIGKIFRRIGLNKNKVEKIITNPTHNVISILAETNKQTIQTPCTSLRIPIDQDLAKTTGQPASPLKKVAVLNPILTAVNANVSVKRERYEFRPSMTGGPK